MQTNYPVVINCENADINLKNNKTFPVRSNEYIKDRNVYWEEKINEGENIWNGTIYTLLDYKESTNIINLELGFSEYKDVIFQHSENYSNTEFHEIRDKFTAVSLVLKTKDKKIVLGKRNSNVYSCKGEYAFIAGSLNYDEIDIKSIKEIDNHIFSELKEESIFDLSQDKIALLGIIIYEGYVNFVYRAEININSKDVNDYNPETEFESFIAINPKDIYSYTSRDYVVDVIENFFTS